MATVAVRKEACVVVLVRGRGVEGVHESRGAGSAERFGEMVVLVVSGDDAVAVVDQAHHLVVAVIGDKGGCCGCRIHWLEESTEPAGPLAQVREIVGSDVGADLGVAGVGVQFRLQAPAACLPGRKVVEKRRVAWLGARGASG